MAAAEPATQPAKPTEDTFTLYTYFRSSCSARLRIALNLKHLTASHKYIHLVKQEQSAPDYLSLNPNGSVPTLIITRPTGETITITQSLAALEYLDEAYPSTYQLLPPPTQPEARAAVRTLSHIIASDVQPVTNLRVLAKVRAMGGNGEEYAREMTARGLKAYETVCRRTAGKFSVGDEVTMADVCLVPAVWAARRWGVDFEGEGLVVISRVVEELEGLESVKKAHWKTQEDTPVELRD